MVDQRIHDQLTAILFEHDPLGLARMGCPNDEYLSEAEEIGELLLAHHASLDVKGVRSLVYKVFVKWFGNVGVGIESDYQAVATEIFQTLLKK